MRRARAARHLVDFDSSVNMVRALGRFLRGKDHRGMSVGPGSTRLANLASAPPYAIRRRVFSAMGAAQGVPLQAVRRIDAADLASWVTRQYGPGPFPAVVVGAASGAAVHLAAALRAPFLPQTLLVAVRDAATDPDDPAEAMAAVAPLATMVARNNPDLTVYHMHDPAQDRPMLERMAYLRLKRQRLGRDYERFLEDRLAPGGTIILLDSTRRWGSTAVGPRTFFQFGCLGGIPEEEYRTGSERVGRFLRAQGSPRRRWDPPEPDAARPEAEWGYDPALTPAIEQLARRRGHRLRRLAVHEPQDLSAFTADFHRWWHARRGLPGDRLLVESYVQWDPLWVLRLGAVPFWLRFNMEVDLELLRGYLDGAKPYAHIHLDLFSQGLASPGIAPIGAWRDLVRSRALRHGELVGIDEDAYPADTGSALRYQPAFAALPPRHPLPAPLPVEAIDEYLDQAGRDYPVRWT